MKNFIIVFIIGTFYSCYRVAQEEDVLAENIFQNIKLSQNIIPKESTNQISCDSIASGLKFTTERPYSKVKRKQFKLRNLLRQEFLKCTEVNKNSFLDSISNVFSASLLNEIIPHWYGTPWDFNGHTSIPNHGEIACGYFVSTTIRDMGMDFNRYDLAKQNPENEARTLAISDSLVLEFTNDNSKEFFVELKGLNQGLYFVGLDNHVGYLYKTESCNYFIHSNYIENRVMIENCTTSEAFDSYEYFITNITGNKALMYYWLFDKRVEVVQL